MNSLVEGNWRLVAIINTVPCIFVIMLNVFILDESIRLLIL